MPLETSSLKVIYLIQTDQGKCPYKISQTSDILTFQLQKKFGKPGNFGKLGKYIQTAILVE